MKIALIGYGKMGKTIERIALERGHEIVSIIDVENHDDIKGEALISKARLLKAQMLQLSLQLRTLLMTIVLKL